ncbi:MAG: ThuA domain-containing protein [Saprospiraceae bacterium]|nr:ThuA domain-containing protein [Saprospiraceae bacterium]
MKRFIKIFLLLVVVSSAGTAQNLKGLKVLLFTKNGKGYVHDNIPAAKHCFDSLSRKFGFDLIINDDPAVFHRDFLNKIGLIVFASTNNAVFDTDDQRLAFRQFIEAGGLFLGIHSVLGTERNWTWFKQMLGGTFAWHPRFQPYQVVNLRPDHESVKHLPQVWQRQDECYFIKEMYPGPHALMAADINSLAMDPADTARIRLHKGTFGRFYPSVWEHRYDGGLAWITALGHSATDYLEPVFVSHLMKAIIYLKANKKKLDFSKAYATRYDDEIRYQGIKK